MFYVPLFPNQWQRYCSPTQPAHPCKVKDSSNEVDSCSNCALASLMQRCLSGLRLLGLETETTAKTDVFIQRKVTNASCRMFQPLAQRTYSGLWGMVEEGLVCWSCLLPWVTSQTGEIWFSKLAHVMGDSSNSSQLCIWPAQGTPAQGHWEPLVVLHAQGCTGCRTEKQNKIIS